MYRSGGNMLEHKSICDDEIFARLTDLFGDSVPTEIILKTGQETKWKLDQCIEKLVKFDPNTFHRPAPMHIEKNTEPSDDDADVLIESEEIQHGSTSAKSQMQSTSQQNDEAAKPTWPFHKQNAGYAATAAQPSNYRTGPNMKQPKLMPTVLEKHPDVADILRHIEQGHRILICMRGAPGSGKSFLARAIIDRTMHGDYDNHIFSTDDFFYDRRTKRYHYDRSKLGQAHDSNQFRVAQRAMNGWSPIIIDNTNMKWWEMFPYFKTAAQNNYIIKILEPNTPWRISVGKLARRNKHNVDQDSIARMLTNYEPGTVGDILRAMQMHNYSPAPQMRQFPEMQNPKDQSEPTFGRFNDSGISRFAPPKDQRPKRYESYRENNDSNSVSTGESNISKLNNFNEQWPAFEDEQTTFWNTAPETNSKMEQNLPKPQRNPTGSRNLADIFSLLQDKSQQKPNDGEKEAEGASSVLKKHKKDCSNENKSFQEIRQIYPQIPVALLWDLFEKCNGDGNWTMDILLNESETKDLQTLNTQDSIDRDNFSCDCEKPSLSLGLSQAVDAIPASWLKDSRAQALPARNQRRQKQNVATENEVVKHIEQQFVISDNHYSDHNRKIRDARRGIPASATITSASNNNNSSAAAKASGSVSPDVNINEDDKMIEIDLGIELVCLLYHKFGSNTFTNENLKDIKTKVFLPKSLGQQLYATWIESLYHQIEEQKQQSIKDDEEFAKKLQVKPHQSATNQNENLFEVTQANSNVQNIADMEYAWKAYNCNSNEWKQQSREDLAMKLTKAKLFEIFPNVEREQLIHVFMAYGNNFGKTVEFFKESLKSDIEDRMQAKGQELVTQARVEAQAVQPPLPTNSKPTKHKIQEIRTLDKMNMEDAKRAALRDFEENRNMAMHHSHLKAECYHKAQEAFQRKQTGVAYYYTTVASLHNSKIDMYNHRAANAIVEVHSYTQQDPNMLDLHYLHADEAIQCLDIYLDRHISELKDAKRGFKYVFIITGRGLHSDSGFSTIKHKVKCRLKERTLSWAEVNPGLLKVKLQYISLFTDNVNNN